MLFGKDTIKGLFQMREVKGFGCKIEYAVLKDRLTIW